MSCRYNWIISFKNNLLKNIERFFWECELEKKRFDETVDRVEKEIIENGRLHKQRQQERKQIREQVLRERREQKAREEELLAEIKDGQSLRR